MQLVPPLPGHSHTEEDPEPKAGRNMALFLDQVTLPELSERSGKKSSPPSALSWPRPPPNTGFFGECFLTRSLHCSPFLSLASRERSSKVDTVQELYLLLGIQYLDLLPPSWMEERPPKVPQVSLWPQA